MDREGALVVGYDLSPSSRRALTQAARLAVRLGTSLTVVHAVNLADYPVDPEGADWGDPAEAVLEDERRAVAGLLAGFGQPWDYRAVFGDPVTALCDAAHEVDAQMIVVGHGPGHGRLGHVLAPAVLPRLVERSGCPVLVVGPDGR